jgi:transcriptional regulator with XRE-family HTH domain
VDPQELRERRRRLGLSQRELAEHLEVTHETISRWERGALNIQAPRMLRLALFALEMGQVNEQTGGPGAGAQVTSTVAFAMDIQRPSQRAAVARAQREMGGGC